LVKGDLERKNIEKEWGAVSISAQRGEGEGLGLNTVAESDRNKNQVPVLHGDDRMESMHRLESDGKKSRCGGKKKRRVGRLPGEREPNKAGATKTKKLTGKGDAAGGDEATNERTSMPEIADRSKVREKEGGQ